MLTSQDFSSLQRLPLVQARLLSPQPLRRLQKGGQAQDARKALWQHLVGLWLAGRTWQAAGHRRARHIICLWLNFCKMHMNIRLFVAMSEMEKPSWAAVLAEML